MDDIDHNNNNIETDTSKTDMPYSAEELMNADFNDPNIDYRAKLFKKYEDVELDDYTGIDDYIHDEDKVALIRYCSNIVKTNYDSYPEPMSDIIVKKMYYDVVKNMNKDEYLEEKKALKNMSRLDQELQKIKVEQSIEYALK